MSYFSWAIICIAVSLISRSMAVGCAGVLDTVSSKAIISEREGRKAAVYGYMALFLVMFSYVAFISTLVALILGIEASL